jgi:hypothetical protein
MNPEFQAISREAGIAAAHIGIGVTALGDANYAEDAYYGQAFFALSIGFERSAKLALVVDHALNNGGAFPSHKILKDFGHRLNDLLAKADNIAEMRTLTGDGRLPQGDIHKAIIAVLSKFAANVTRYYNLDFLTNAPSVAAEDAVSEWHREVTSRVLALHYPARVRARDEARASQMQSLMGGFSSVVHTSETGAAIRSVEAAALHGAATEYVKPWTRMYVLQIARFISELMFALTGVAYGQQAASIPHLSEFYAIYMNDDRYFRARKRWSIYGR